MSKIDSVNVPHLNMLSSLEDQLNKFSLIEPTTFNEDLWKIRVLDGGVAAIDFSIFQTQELAFFEKLKLNYDSMSFDITPVMLAKILWLGMSSGLSGQRGNLNSPYESLKLIFYYLKEQEMTAFNANDFEPFLCFFFFHYFSGNSLKKRMSPPHYASRPILNFIRKMQSTLNRYGIQLVLNHFPDENLNKSMNKACLAMMDMTFSEYRQGGSYNYLGLEVGKHYIDHCYTFFDTNYSFVCALNTAVTSFANTTAYRSAVSTQLLIGNAPEKVHHEKLSLITRHEIEDSLHKVFRDAFMKAEKIRCIFSLETINHLAGSLGVSARYDGEEFVRSLLLDDLFLKTDGKSKQMIWKEYESALHANGESLLITLDEFETSSSNYLSEAIQRLPKGRDSLRRVLKDSLSRLYRSLKLSVNGLHSLKNLIERLAQVGATCFLGITGWRRSEFGFTLNDIKIRPNNDVSDNFYTPWRFHIHWIVPKTDGNTKLNREITSTSYILLTQIDHLKQSLSGGMVLGDHDYMYSACKRLWNDFVFNYKLFSPTHKFENNYQKAEVKRIVERLREELPIIDLANTRKGFTDILIKFREGGLSNKNLSILKNRLSPDTLTRSLSPDYTLDSTNSRAIRSELLSDVLFPSPHAFRHIWAEAVLMRYRGDVGRFIRAHFQHMDERFFIAYLRDKDMQLVTLKAERSVISIIVQYYIDAENGKYREHVSKLPRFLELAVERTEVYSHDEYIKKVMETAEDRVSSITANPWCTCIRRVGTDNRAACSINGVAQTHNAKPAFCLGCTNADITKANLRGIMVFTRHDVEACLNQKLPVFIKSYHAKVVRTALAAIEKIRSTSENKKPYDIAIRDLEEALSASSNE